MSTAALAELGSLVSTVSVDAEERRRVAVDRSGTRASSLPDGVVVAERIADVQATLAWANRHRVPVVPRGAGTGLAGGAVATAGSVVLDLHRLDRIVAIDPLDELAEVEAGVLTAAVDAAAREHGLFYAPDPASAAISTIGGNLATNAGGMRCVKHGVTRDSVLGLDVVLADGRRVRTGRATVKGVTGYDLTSLFVGSEGTLGVVVGATLRLRPVPAATATASAAYASVEAAADACAALTRARLRPSLLELLDGATLTVIDRAQGTRLRSRGAALVIVQTDGREADGELDAVLDVLREGATWSAQASDAAEAEELLAARRLALPSIERFGTALIEDVCVPRSRLAEAVRGVEEIAARLEVAVYTFAHAGDGNLHPILAYDGAAEAPPDAVVEAADAIFALALALGGTVTGEHGIGRLKRAWARRELGDDAIDLHRAVKAALDPHGILNPGVGF